jgi:hypothetical protein
MGDIKVSFVNNQVKALNKKLQTARTDQEVDKIEREIASLELDLSEYFPDGTINKENFVKMAKELSDAWKNDPSGVLSIESLDY